MDKNQQKNVEEQHQADDNSRWTGHSQKLLNLYKMVQDGSVRDRLSYMLLATNESYMIADKEAARVLQQKEVNKSIYTGRSGKLMDYSYDETVDRSTDEVIINLLTVAINNYLADKQELPSDISTLNKVKALFMQIIVRGTLNILKEINIPPYLVEMVKSAEDKLDEGLINAFEGWIQDLKETGNEHLIDWVRKECGTAIFGTEVTTKSKDKYNQYMAQFIGSINNPSELYQRFIKRRNEYNDCVNNVQYVKLYDIFEMTADQFSKTQNKLYTDFQLNYSENINAQYIKELLNG